jgi:putative PIN family toxin of toxin-antitoxin system
MRIVLDSNILVRAAWKADGLASRLLRNVLEGPHRLIVSPFILGEVARVLAYPRIQSRWGLSEERIQGHVNRLAAVAEIVETASVDRVVPDDPDDDFVIHTAIAGRADVLCTRDSHLLDHRVAQYCTQRGIRIMDDIELYSILIGRLEPGSVGQP